MLLLSWIYTAALVGLAVFGYNMLLMLGLTAWRRRQPKPPRPPAVWPPVVVQLPIFNERYVVERLINAAAALDYPRSASSFKCSTTRRTTRPPSRKRA